MLATDPADRPQTAEAVAESLKRIADTLVSSSARSAEPVGARQPFAARVPTEIELTRRPERLGPEPAEDTPVPPLQPPRRGRIWATAFLALAATAAVVALTAGGASHGNSPGPQRSAASDGGSDPGAGQFVENELPGPVTVTASRLDAAKLRFRWTYSAQLATGTFAWRTDDGKLTGTASAPSVDLADPAGVRMCVQI